MLSTSEFGQAHIPLFKVGGVHLEGFAQAVRRMAGGREGQVLAQQRAIVGVGTVLDDELRAFTRAFSPQVGHSLFGHNDGDIVLCVIGVAHHRDDGGDGATLGRRWAHENRVGCGTGEIAAAADAVHDRGAEEVGGVDVAEDIDLDSCIGADEANVAGHFGVVGDFLRPQKQFVFVEVKVLVDFSQYVVGHRQGAAGRKGAAPAAQQCNRRILDDFGVHLEVRDVFVAGQSAQHGVGDVAYAALYGQEALRDAAKAVFFRQKLSNVLADDIRGAGGWFETRDAVFGMGVDNADDFGRVYFEGFGADAGVGGIDSDFTPVGRILRYVDVVDLADFRFVVGVELQDNTISQHAEGRGVAAAGCQRELAVICHRAHLNDGRADLRQVGVAHILRHERYVAVDVFDAPCVDGVTGFFAGLVRHETLHTISG